MGFTEAIKSVYSQYATFEGRARRSEYWWFQLFFFLVYLVLVIPMTLLSSGNEPNGLGVVFLVLFFAFVIGTIIPMISVLVRRLHDTNRTGWWYWISLIPFIGGIWLFVLTVLESTPGDNRFGPQP